MPNTKQNNQIDHVNKDLQDLSRKSEKSKNQFQNGLMEIGRIRVKKGKSTN